MNCHLARQLISAYLDYQLTGQQMLALREHFDGCASCEAERQSIQEVKALLRALHPSRPRPDLPGAITARVAQSQQPFSLAALRPAAYSPPPRGRRLSASLALSFLTLLFLAAPFAPASRKDAFRPASLFSARAAVAAPEVVSPLSLMAMPSTDARPAEFLTLTESDESRRERLFAAQYVQPGPPGQSAVAEGDDAVRGYVQGDAAFAGDRMR